MAAGAAAVLTDPAGARLAAGATVPVVVVDDPRQAMAEAAAAIYGRPAEAMTMYAVTGTNGKTTTTFLLDAALRAAGVRTGVVGTIGFFLDGQPLAATRTTVTTPEATELQGLLGYLREQGAEAVLMEVSSHALALGRVDAIVFAVAAFTNLGRDHLDFHLDEEAYFEAKASLFTPERTRRAVVNVDDPRGRQLAERVVRDGEVELTTVGLGGTTDVAALSCDLQDDGRTAVRARLRSRLGRVHPRPAGRLQRAERDHRPGHGRGDRRRRGRGGRRAGRRVGPRADAAGRPRAGGAGGLRRLRPHPAGGDRRPGGGRDRGGGSRCSAAAATGTRPSGGRWAPRPPQHADLVVVTDDNPRSEDPAAIRAEVLAGARAGHRDRPRWSTAATAAPPSGWRCSGPDRATSSRCSARATSSARRSAARCSRSATRRSSPPSGPRVRAGGRR